MHNCLSFFVFFAAETVQQTKSSSSTAEVVWLVLKICVATAIGLAAYHFIQKLRRGNNHEELLTLQKHFQLFKDARDEGELSDEEYVQIHQKLSAKMMAEIRQKGLEPQNKIKTMSNQEKRLKK